MGTKEEIQNVRAIVEKILTEQPETRDDDKLLTFRVLQYTLIGRAKDRLLTLRTRDLKRLPAFETVTRVRARIQNDEHKLLPEKESVRKLRRIREEDFRTWATGTPLFPAVAC